MAIDKANILTFVNNALKTADTNIDVEIQAILDDLSEHDLLEASDDSVELESGDDSFAIPTGFRDFSAITLTNASDVNLDPLLEIPGGIKEYRRLKSNDSAIGTPQWYVVFGDTVFIWRSANGDYEVLIEYTKDHPQDVDDIEFGDIFKNAIYFGVTAEVAARLNRTAGINLWLPKYLAAKQKRIDSKPEQPSIAIGQDWGW